ncbi:MAG: alpha/beta hydrolase [Anaerolineales bacterium]|nr:alpha/beta hydrolase [Anaerolineae bacterium]PWB56858.1 MAG: alpha/beta hydrolase [Anaerolineales bacterium]
MKRLIKHPGALALAGGLTLLLVGPLLIPVPPLKGTFKPRDLADDDSEFIQLNGLDIHVKRAGQGELVFVLLHGFAASLYSWHAVTPALSQLGKVIAYDRPGFGLSSHPLVWKGQNPYSLDSQVALLHSLLDHFGIRQAILVGNSAGGTLAMQAALAYPERVSALVLVDPAIYHGMGTPAWLRPVLTTPQMRRMGPLFTRQVLTRGRDLLKLAWHDPDQITPEMEQFYQKPFRVENWDKALWEFTLASQASNLSARLNEISMPVLVVTGDDDRIVPTADSVKLAKALPNGTLHVIGNTGHVPHEEKPQAFMDAVSQFISNLTQENIHA